MKEKKKYTPPTIVAIPCEPEHILKGSAPIEDFKREEFEWDDEDFELEDEETYYSW